MWPESPFRSRIGRDLVLADCSCYAATSFFVRHARSCICVQQVWVGIVESDDGQAEGKPSGRPGEKRSSGRKRRLEHGDDRVVHPTVRRSPYYCVHHVLHHNPAVFFTRFSPLGAFGVVVKLHQQGVSQTNTPTTINNLSHNLFLLRLLYQYVQTQHTIAL